MVISNHLVGATAKEKHGGGKDGDKRCEAKEEVVTMDVPVDTQDTKRRLVSARALQRALGCPLHTAGVDSRQLFGQSKRTIGHDVQPAAFISLSLPFGLSRAVRTASNERRVRRRLVAPLLEQPAELRSPAHARRRGMRHLPAPTRARWSDCSHPTRLRNRARIGHLS